MPSINSRLTPATRDRELRALALRFAEAGRDASAGILPQIDNGDEERYPDKVDTYRGTQAGESGRARSCGLRLFHKSATKRRSGGF